MIFNQVEEQIIESVDKIEFSNDKKLWVEKYRPQRLEYVIIPNRIRVILEKLDKAGIDRHILLHGDTGTGKTTIARILTRKYSKLFTNASKENGIGVVRDVITPYVSVTSLNNRPKAVVLDEMDNLTTDAQLSLRGLIEDSAKTTRYIGTCNYPEKIEKAILSRFGLKIDFNFTGDERREVAKQSIIRIKAICGNEGMTITDDALIELIGKYTDFRDIIELLQTMHEIGCVNIKLSDLLSYSSSNYVELFKMILKKQDIFIIRKYILQNHPNQYYDIIIQMGDKMINWVYESKHEILPKCGIIYVLANKSKVDSRNMPDQLTSLMSLISEIQHIL